MIERDWFVNDMSGAMDLRSVSGLGNENTNCDPPSRVHDIWLSWIHIIDASGIIRL